MIFNVYGLLYLYCSDCVATVSLPRTKDLQHRIELVTIYYIKLFGQILN